MATDASLIWHHVRSVGLVDALDQYIAGMTEDEKLGQLFIAEDIGTDYNLNNAIMLEQMHVGGILLYTANMQTVPQTRALIATSQAHAKIPLFVSVDEEGGFVDRLEQFYGRRPSATEIGESGNVALAHSEGVRAARDLSDLGFNFDFAPDVDVQLVPGADLRTRTFGATPDAVTQFAGAYLAGLQSTGQVTGCLKHFPGLGSVLGDAHLDLPIVTRDRGQIETVELAPYRALIATGQVQVIMPTDLLLPAVDPTLPAELSPAIMTGLLRGELGYNGVIVTDALYMQGITKTYSMPEAAVLAILAGDDLLVGASTPQQMAPMIEALRAALHNGRLSPARLDQSIRRILTLKIKMGLMPLPTVNEPIPPTLP